MVNEIKKLIRQSGIYSFGNFTGHILSFLLLPVYTRLLTTEQYGILAIITVFKVIFQRVVNLGTQSSVVKVYFELDTQRERKVLISTAFLFLLLVALFFTGLCLLLRESFSTFLLDSANLSYLFTIALLGAFFFIIKTIPLAIFRAQERAGIYTFFSLLTLILGLSFNIIFVIIFRQDVRGILRSALLSQMIVFALVLIPFSRNICLKFSSNSLKRMLSFGLPLVPSGLAMWILTLLDRYFLKVFTTMDIVGVYSLGYKISTIMSMLVIVPFSMAWVPLMLRWYKEGSSVEIYVKVFKYFSIAGFFVALLISIFSKEVIQVMTTPPFYGAYKIVYFIVIAYLFHGFYMIFSAGCTFARKSYFFPIATGAAAILNTILNIVLIPRMQMMGAAVATIISYFLMTLLVYIFSERYYHIPFNFSETIRISFITTGLYLLGFLISGNIFYLVFYKIIIVLSYFPLLYIFRVIHKKEIGKFLKLIKMRIQK